MLTHIQVNTLSSTVLELPLAEGNTPNMFQVKDIQGLGPVKATVNTVPFTTRGEAFINTVVGKRNIVFTFKLNPDWASESVSDLREALYEFFMPGLGLVLVFQDTVKPDRSIFAIVEGVEPNIFSRDPEVQVSLLCPNPDFLGVDAEVETAAGVINNPGSVPTGFIVEITAGAGEVKFGTSLPVAEWFGLDLPEGATFTVNTTPGQKAVSDDLLRYMLAGSSWPQLWPGNNTFYTTGPVSALEITYNPRYGGL